MGRERAEKADFQAGSMWALVYYTGRWLPWQMESCHKPRHIIVDYAITLIASRIAHQEKFVADFKCTTARVQARVRHFLVRIVNISATQMPNSAVSWRCKFIAAMCQCNSCTHCRQARLAWCSYCYCSIFIARNLYYANNGWTE